MQLVIVCLKENQKREYLEKYLEKLDVCWKKCAAMNSESHWVNDFVLSFFI